MSDRCIVTGGTVVTSQAVIRADIVIQAGKIVGLTLDSGTDPDPERIDATGLLVMPGGIDGHTHFREPDPNSHEGFLSGSHGAAAGGITTVVEMPQAGPTTATLEQFQQKVLSIGTSSIVDMALWGGILGGPERDPDHIFAMADAGASGFKSFMAASSPSFPAVDTAKLFWAMQVVADTGLPYALHAEDDATLQNGIRRMKVAGRKDPMAHAESRPPLVESVAVAQALYLAEITGCWLHICHAASADALALIRDAKSRGVLVTVETCPQYLALNTDDLVAQRGFARCAPALRDQSEVEAIWEFVANETIDTICSDHSAFTAESKQTGDLDIFEAPNGISGIETLYPATFDAMVNQRGLSPIQFVRQLSSNPASLFGLSPDKGDIAIGADADLVLFDPDHVWTVRGSDLHHRQKWTPFEGKSIKGQVIRTMRRGETLFNRRSESGKLLSGLPGSGHFLPRDRPPGS